MDAVWSGSAATGADPVPRGNKGLSASAASANGITDFPAQLSGSVAFLSSTISPYEGSRPEDRSALYRLAGPMALETCAAALDPAYHWPVTSVLGIAEFEQPRPDATSERLAATAALQQRDSPSVIARVAELRASPDAPPPPHPAVPTAAPLFPPLGFGVPLDHLMHPPSTLEDHRSASPAIITDWGGEMVALLNAPDTPERAPAVAAWARRFCDAAVPLVALLAANVARLPFGVWRVHHDGITLEIPALDPRVAAAHGGVSRGLPAVEMRELNRAATDEYASRAAVLRNRPRGLNVPFTVNVKFVGLDVLAYPRLPGDAGYELEAGAAESLSNDAEMQATLSAGVSSGTFRKLASATMDSVEPSQPPPPTWTLAHGALDFEAALRDNTPNAACQLAPRSLDIEATGVAMAVAERLRLRPHWVSQRNFAPLSPDVQLWRGHDNRLYLLRARSILPLQPTVSGGAGGGAAIASGAVGGGAPPRDSNSSAASLQDDYSADVADVAPRRFRPEFLEHRRPMDGSRISCDAGTPFAHPAEMGIDTATRAKMLRHITDFLVPQAVRQLIRDMRACDVPQVEFTYGAASRFLHRWGINISYTALAVKAAAPLAHGRAAETALQHLVAEVVARALHASIVHASHDRARSVALAQTRGATGAAAVPWRTYVHPACVSMDKGAVAEDLRRWAVVAAGLATCGPIAAAAAGGGASAEVTEGEAAIRRAVARRFPRDASIMSDLKVRSILRSHAVEWLRRLCHLVGARVIRGANIIEPQDLHMEEAATASPGTFGSFILPDDRILFSPRVQCPPVPPAIYGAEGETYYGVQCAREYLSQSPAFATTAIGRRYVDFLHAVGESWLTEEELAGGAHTEDADSADNAEKGIHGARTAHNARGKTAPVDDSELTVFARTRGDAVLRPFQAGTLALAPFRVRRHQRVQFVAAGSRDLFGEAATDPRAPRASLALRRLFVRIVGVRDGKLFVEVEGGPNVGAVDTPGTALSGPGRQLYKSAAWEWLLHLHGAFPLPSLPDTMMEVGGSEPWRQRQGVECPTAVLTIDGLKLLEGAPFDSRRNFGCQRGDVLFPQRGAHAGAALLILGTADCHLFAWSAATSNVVRFRNRRPGWFEEELRPLLVHDVDAARAAHCEHVHALAPARWVVFRMMLSDVAIPGTTTSTRVKRTRDPGVVVKLPPAAVGAVGALPPRPVVEPIEVDGAFLALASISLRHRHIIQCTIGPYAGLPLVVLGAAVVEPGATHCICLNLAAGPRRPVLVSLGRAIEEMVQGAHAPKIVGIASMRLPLYTQAAGDAGALVSPLTTPRSDAATPSLMGPTPISPLHSPRSPDSAVSGSIKALPAAAEGPSLEVYVSSALIPRRSKPSSSAAHALDVPPTGSVTTTTATRITSVSAMVVRFGFVCGQRVKVILGLNAGCCGVVVGAPPPRHPDHQQYASPGDDDVVYVALDARPMPGARDADGAWPIRTAYIRLLGTGSVAPAAVEAESAASSRRRRRRVIATAAEARLSLLGAGAAATSLQVLACFGEVISVETTFEATRPFGVYSGQILRIPTAVIAVPRGRDFCVMSSQTNTASGVDLVPGASTDSSDAEEDDTEGGSIATITVLGEWRQQLWVQRAGYSCVAFPLLALNELDLVMACCAAKPDRLWPQYVGLTVPRPLEDAFLIAATDARPTRADEWTPPHLFDDGPEVCDAYAGDHRRIGLYRKWAVAGDHSALANADAGAWLIPARCVERGGAAAAAAATSVLQVAGHLEGTVYVQRLTPPLLALHGWRWKEFAAAVPLAEDERRRWVLASSLPSGLDLHIALGPLAAAVLGGAAPCVPRLYTDRHGCAPRPLHVGAALYVQDDPESRLLVPWPERDPVARPALAAAAEAQRRFEAACRMAVETDARGLSYAEAQQRLAPVAAEDSVGNIFLMADAARSEVRIVGGIVAPLRWVRVTTAARWLHFHRGIDVVRVAPETFAMIVDTAQAACPPGSAIISRVALSPTPDDGRGAVVTFDPPEWLLPIHAATGGAAEDVATAALASASSRLDTAVWGEVVSRATRMPNASAARAEVLKRFGWSANEPGALAAMVAALEEVGVRPPTRGPLSVTVFTRHNAEVVADVLSDVETRLGVLLSPPTDADVIRRTMPAHLTEPAATARDTSNADGIFTVEACERAEATRRYTTVDGTSIVLSDRASSSSSALGTAEEGDGAALAAPTHVSTKQVALTSALTRGATIRYTRGDVQNILATVLGYARGRWYRVEEGPLKARALPFASEASCRDAYGLVAAQAPPRPLPTSDEQRWVSYDGSSVALRIDGAACRAFGGVLCGDRVLLDTPLGTALVWVVLGVSIPDGRLFAAVDRTGAIPVAATPEAFAALRPRRLYSGSVASPTPGWRDRLGRFEGQLPGAHADWLLARPPSAPASTGVVARGGANKMILVDVDPAACVACFARAGVPDSALLVPGRRVVSGMPSLLHDSLVIAGTRHGAVVLARESDPAVVWPVVEQPLAALLLAPLTTNDNVPFPVLRWPPRACIMPTATGADAPDTRPFRYTLVGGNIGCFETSPTALAAYGVSHGELLRILPPRRYGGGDLFDSAHSSASSPFAAGGGSARARWAVVIGLRQGSLWRVDLPAAGENKADAGGNTDADDEADETGDQLGFPRAAPHGGATQYVQVPAGDAMRAAEGGPVPVAVAARAAAYVTHAAATAFTGCQDWESLTARFYAKRTAVVVAVRERLD